MKRIIILLALVSVYALPAFATVKRADSNIAWMIGLNTSQIWTGLSTDTKPVATGTTSIVRGAAFIETNTQNIYFYNGTSWTLKDDGVITGPDTLSAPGWIAISVKGFKNAVFSWKITAVNTAISHLLQGKVGSSGWFSVVGVDSVRCPANKDSSFTYIYCSGLDSLRYNFISEAGGTAAVIPIWSKKGK